MRDKILEKAGKMFIDLGFKSVTMDDISNELGMSKKTLYKFFSSKNALVEESTAVFHDSLLEVIDQIVAKEMNPIAQNFEIQNVLKEMFKNAASSPVYQLKKYYPKVYKKLMEKEAIAFSKCSKENIERGIAQGYYRENIEIEVCSQFYFSLIFSVHGSTIDNNKIPFLEQQVLVYHTRAIATEKGIQELEKQLQQD